jgi:hypothetical protein
MESRSHRVGLQAAAVLVGLLGALKIYGVVTHRVGHIPDGVLGMPTNGLALGAGLIELGLSVLMLGMFSPIRSAQGLSVWGFCLVCYLVAHAWSGGAVACPCLGPARQWLGLSAATEERLLLSIAVWWLLVGLLAWAREQLCR